jgi:uncharacterized glyoxalase superfamily protein PhnB
VDDVDKVYKALKAKGVEFITEPKDQDWGARAATLVDPQWKQVYHRDVEEVKSVL